MVLKFVVRIISLLSFISLISFLYVYLTMLNPFIYLDFIIWIIFATLIFFGIQMLKLDHPLFKLTFGICVSLFAIYLTYGIQSTYFYQIVVNNSLNGKIPSLNFIELKNTLFSSSNYYQRVRILLEYSDMSIGKGSKKDGVSLGESFMNFFRLVECLGILVIPIVQLFKAKELFSSKPKSKEGVCVHCKGVCMYTHFQRTEVIRYDCPKCGKYEF